MTFRSRVYEYYDADVNSVAGPVKLAVRTLARTPEICGDLPEASVISKRTGLPERVVRGVVWDLIAQGRLDLTSTRKIVVP